MGFNSDWSPGTDPIDIAIFECLQEIKAQSVGKHVNILDGYCDPETGEPVLLVVTTTCADDGTSTTTTETIPMAGLTPAVPSDDDNIPLSAQVTSFKLRDEFKGTVADVLALAIGEAEPVFTDVDETPATAPYICDYNILALACKTICLKDPLDVESGAPVEKDGTFINGVQVRTDGDPMKGGVDLEAPVSQVAGGVSVWCFTFSAEADKGNNIIVKE